MADSRRLTICFTALLMCFVMVCSVWAAPYEIHFQNGTMTPPAGQFMPATGHRSGTTHALVQLENYIQKGDREALKAAGVELLVYLPDRAYMAALDDRYSPTRCAELAIRSVTPLPAEYKLHPRVAHQSFGPWSSWSGGRRIFAVSIMPDVELDDAEALLKTLGAEVGHHFVNAHTLLAALDYGRLADVAALDEVLYINEATPPLSPLNNTERQRLHVNEVQAAPYNLSGDGVTIMVYDGGMIDSTHTGFGDRVTWSEAGTVADHPTHVAGTVGGAGQGASHNYRGMAPSVRIISGEYDACVPYCLYESPNDFFADYTSARAVHHIELTTNSIGANIDPNSYDCDWFGDYETTSQVLDGLVRDTDGAPMIMFFAAGNERNGTHCAMNTYGCMSVPAGAKNIITVGSTGSTDQPSSFSSWGPTDDGRVKPEVCADGENIMSSVPGNNYGQMSGTSMATPASAGVGCLILQQWHLLFPGAPDPLPETMKAILINSTTEVGAVGPDFGTGYGVVNALKAVQNLLRGGVLESSLDMGEEFTRTFAVVDSVTALDVSLAWSDIPAVGNVVPTLVNDLDLFLVDPSGTTYRPWRLRPGQPTLPAQTGVDTVNVCERVHVNNPAEGVWTLHVTGQLNGSTSQTFGVSSNVTLVPDWAVVHGQIRNAATQTGVRGRVTVTGSSQAITTDTTGSYVLTMPAGLSYTLHAISFGYAPRDTQLTTISGSVLADLNMTAVSNGELTVHLSNQFGSPVEGASVEIYFPTVAIPVVTTDATGNAVFDLPGANHYGITLRFLDVVMTAEVDLAEGAMLTVPMTVNDPRYAPAGPDGEGYSAYEIPDGFIHATYDWMEISPRVGGSGTLVQGASGNDWVVNVTLPFPMRFYGIQSTTAHISADGWVGFGTDGNGNRPYRNVGIPNDTTPNALICVFWDDLIPYASNSPDSGDISTYYDQPNGRFIVEYHRVPQFNPRRNTVTAQLVIYDQTVRPTISENNEFEIQYQHVDYYSGMSQTDADATIGIESRTGTDGLQLGFDGTWDPACFEVDSGYAVRFTTGPLAGYGTVQGQITMVPPPADYTQVAVTFGSYTVHPNATGAFSEDSVIAGSYTMSVTLAGYETGTAASFNVDPDGSVTRNFTLFRLDPPTNLVATLSPSPFDIEVDLRWNSPALPDTAVTGYQVWLAPAQLLATVTDTAYGYLVPSSGTFTYWVKAVYRGGISDTSNHASVVVSAVGDPHGNPLPTEFYLKPNYPNPFNPTTQIEYGLPRDAQVVLEVFDVLGRRIQMLADGWQTAGVHTVTFHGDLLGSGVYYCRLRANNFTQIQKMVLMR